VVKTLGSGFHIPAEGVHYLPKVSNQLESKYLHIYIYIIFIRPMTGCCEHGNEPLGSISGGEFVD
jgi:hypothetical protein